MVILDSFFFFGGVLIFGAAGSRALGVVVTSCPTVRVG